MFSSGFRGFLALLFLLIQISLVAFVYNYFVDQIEIIKILYSFFCLYFILMIIKNSKNYSFTLPWILIFMVVPIPASILYLVIGSNKKRSKVLKNIVKEEKNKKKYFVQDENLNKECSNNSSINYITNYSGYPVSDNNDVEYYPLGEIAFEHMISELKKAEKFIFMEYFIVNHGKMWDSILEVLEQKVKEGVEVRVMYDDLGCLTTLDTAYPKTLESKGIKCVSFNRLKLFAGVIMNNRDHRKILVIDGKVAFSGGINIADEYINIGSKYGHWKDNGIKISGDAVWNYTVMFLTMWNACKKEDNDYLKYKYEFKNKKNNKSKGYVIPYGSSPLENETTGEDIYLNIINRADKYLYIFTPYLIIDNNMINALCLAAKRGVDVRIVIPGIPDKKIVYTLSESYIEPLVKGGVKLYKYTPGFVHAKVFVSDDKVATVGTINMDYRSLYLHFECGCYLENVEAIKDIKEDLVKTIDECHLVTKKEANTGRLKSVGQAILRLFAPLM